MCRVYATWILSLAAGWIGLAGARWIVAADWTTWRGDAARSGVTGESLSTDLVLQWQLALPRPSPAWPDEQGKVRFDASYEPVAAQGHLFVPSMVDDCVAAYRLADGQLVWRFFTDGPVRFAPVVWRDRVLFVSDDGYLYCVRAADGSLIWRLRGGPQERRVLGNERLISMWPARGAPVVKHDVLYWAAGVWPFMGIFVQAVDLVSGQPIWTNSGSGSDYITQQHASPAFAGVAPQGYLTADDTTLLVAGGMTSPAAYDLRTGALRYYRPGDRELGKDQGGYEVKLGPDWFSNHGRVHRLEDGIPLLKAPVDIVTPECLYGVSGKHLVAFETRVDRQVETTVDAKGKEKQTVKYTLPQRWRTALPEGITRLHVLTPQQLVVTDDAARLALLNVPQSEADGCRVLWQYALDDPIWRAIVADGRLIVVGQRGSISCFGAPGAGAAAVARLSDAPAVDLQTAGTEAERDLLAALSHATSRAGYAIIDQPVDEHGLVALARETQFHVLALHDDPQRREELRLALRSRGVLGTRIALVPGSLRTAGLPQYLADLIVTGAKHGAATDVAAQLAACTQCLRPYSGTAVWMTDGLSASAVPEGALGPDLQVEAINDGLVIRRAGPLPGAGSWTHQNGDAGNTLVSTESRLQAPLGLLWFGGPSNQGVLPRHGHGPVPQVVGGRLFIEGRDMLRAVDVYTGRLVWQRELKDVGIFYDNTDHHPGAGAIGGNYVCTSDSVYVVWGRTCLRLDPATGETLTQFALPPDESGQEPFWGYMAVHGDLLIAGSSPMLLLARGPGETIDKEDKEQLKRAMPLFAQFGEGSRRLVVMNRFDGSVRWTRDAQFNFRHNAIAVGDGKVFCIDRMTQQRLAHFRRRGQVPVSDFCLYALDLVTGEPVWQSTEHTFGTWLAYSEPTGLLLEAGSKFGDRAEDEVGQGLTVLQAANGQLVWRNDDNYGGPPLLYPDAIVTQGTAYDLRTGASKTRIHPLTGEPLRWTFARNHGCTTAIGCLTMLTFRSAAAGYFDLANDGGTGNWGGFRSSCTSNLVPADGVLNAPDYTRTCTCSYQNQCSLALVSMPDVETWTFNSYPAGAQRVTRLGLNFGAPGDRKTEEGTLWLDYPSVGGPSPDVPVTLAGERIEYVREHASLYPPARPAWVFASGVRGVQHLRVQLASPDQAGGSQVPYQVRLFWRNVDPTMLQSADMDVRLQGQPARDHARILGDSAADLGFLIQQWDNVPVGEFLEMVVQTPRGASATSPQPLLCGMEVVAQ